MVFSVKWLSESWVLLVYGIVVWTLLTYFSFEFSSNIIVIPTCSSLSTKLLKTKSGSRINDECDVLSVIAILRNCGVKVVINFPVIFVF